MLHIPTAEDILAANGLTPFKMIDSGGKPPLKDQKQTVKSEQQSRRRRTTKKAGIKVSKRHSRRR
jgi:hypothetical protein